MPDPGLSNPKWELGGGSPTTELLTPYQLRRVRGTGFPPAREPGEPVFETSIRGARDLQDFRARVNFSDVLFGHGDIKPNVRKQVDLV